MKTLYWIIGALAVAGAAAYYFLVVKKPKAAAAPTVQTTGTATGINPWFNSGKVGQAFNATLALATAAQSSYSAISNAWGTNDGGNSGGVSVGGSAAGGIQSSGSGAGVPAAGAVNIMSWFTGGTGFA